MGNEGSKELPDPEGPIVDSMVAKWGRESVTFLPMWSRDFSFPHNGGSFSIDKIKLLSEKLLKEEDELKKQWKGQSHNVERHRRQ